MKYFNKITSICMALIMIVTVNATTVFAAWSQWVPCAPCSAVGTITTNVSCPPKSTDRCSNCRGSGTDSSLVEYECGSCRGAGGSCITCGGSGKITQTTGRDCDSCSGKGSTTSTCSLCSGTGLKKQTTTCTTCNGAKGQTYHDTLAPTLTLSKSIDATNPAYSGENVTVTASGTDIARGGELASGVSQYSFDNGVTWGGNTHVVPSTAGTVTINVKAKDTAGNISATQSILVKTMLNQTPIVIDSPTNPIYGTDFPLTTTGGSTGNEIVWVVSSGNATISSSGVVTPTGVGQVTVQATMPGNANYFDAVITIDFTIAPKELTTTGAVTIEDKVYDGNVVTTPNSTLNLVGIVGNDDVIIAPITANFNDKDVAKNKAVTINSLTLSGAHAANYSFVQPALTGYTASISAKELTVDNSEIANKIYDGNTSANHVAPPALVGVVTGEDVSLEVGTPTFGDANIGTDKPITIAPFSIKGAAIGNYTLTQPAAAAASITTKELTVKDINVNDKVYDGTTSAKYSTAPSFVGIIGSDDVQIINGTPTFDNKNIGENKIVSHSPFTATGEHAKNYAIVQPSETTANITKRELSVAPFEVAEKTYDGKDSADFVTPPTLVGAADADDITLEGGKITVETIDVGNVKVTINEFKIVGTDIGNYTFTQPTLTGFTTTIVPRVITVTPNPNQSKEFGMTDPVFTFTHTPLIGSDVTSGIISRQVGENAGSYPFIIGDLSAGNNYKFEVANSTFNIKKTSGVVELTATKSKTTPIDVSISAWVCGDDGVVEFYVMGEKITTSKVINGVATAKYRPLSVGTYKVSAILRNSSNFKDTMSEDAFFNVTSGDLKPPKKVIPFFPLDKSSSTVSDNSSKQTKEIPEKINLPKREDNKKKTSSSSQYTRNDTSYDTNYGFTDEVNDEVEFTEITGENILTNEPLEFRVTKESDPNLILVDVTDASDMEAYEKLLQTENISKNIIGVYSAKMFLDDEEIENSDVVTIEIPLDGKFANKEQFEVVKIDEKPRMLQVKSEKASISFETDSLGYFAVLGVPKTQSSVNWGWIVGGITALLAAGGLFWWFLLLWKRDKDEEEEETK